MTKYFGNPLVAFMQGIDMDYRVKLAAEMLRNGATMDASVALEESSRLVQMAEERGLLRPLLEGDDLPQEVRDQLLREARAQALQQASAQRLMREEAPRMEHPGASKLDSRRQ